MDFFSILSRILRVMSLGILVCGASGFSQDNRSKCADAFAHLRFKDIETVSPELSKFLNSRAIVRLLSTQPPTYKAIEDSIAIARNGVGVLRFEIENDELKAGLSVSRKDSEISVTIDYITLTEAGDKKNKSYMDWGERNKTLNMGFPRLLSAVASGINRQIATDPNIDKVILRGSTVVNEHLAQQLERFGFTSSPGNSQSPAKRANGGIPFVLNSMTQYVGVLFKILSVGNSNNNLTSSAPYVKITKGAVGSIAGAKKIKAVKTGDTKGSNWELVLELENESVPNPASN